MLTHRLSLTPATPATPAKKYLKADLKTFSSFSRSNVKLAVAPKANRPVLKKLRAVEEKNTSTEVEEKNAVREHDDVAKKVFEDTFYAGEGDAPTGDASSSAESTESLEQLLKIARAELAKDEVDKAALSDLVDRVAAAGAKVEAAAAAGARAEHKVKDAIRKCEAMANQMAELTQDFENFKRRALEGQAQLEADAKGRLVKDLIPLLDNFELARTSLKASTEGEQKIHSSYQGLYKQLNASLTQLGVEAVPTVGTPFDPNCHEAVLRAPSSEHPDGTVLKEFRRGFKLGGKLVRPAMVQVSYNEEAEAKPAAADKQ